MSLDWSPLAEIVDRHDRFLVACHVRPDGDALGSAIGMASLLKAKGKDARVVSPSPIPPRYDFLDPDGTRIGHFGGTVAEADLADREVLIIVDLSSWAQLGDLADYVRRFPGQKVVIDHHVSQDDLGALVLKDTSAEAAGTLVLRAARDLGVVPDEPMATALLAAIATDTGWFRHPNATAETLRDAAELVEAGASIHRLYGLLYERNSPARLRLVGHVLSTMQLDLDGRLATASIGRDDLARTGALPDDTADLIEHLVSLQGVEVAALLIEPTRGGVRGSFRSRRGFDCASLAASLGGGGHKAAAGVTLREPWEEGRARILTVLRRAMKGDEE